MDISDTQSGISDAWNGVIEYLKTNKASKCDSMTRPLYVLDLPNIQQDLNTSNSMDLAMVANGATVLSTLRRSKTSASYSDDDDNNMEIETVGNTSKPSGGKIDGSYEWAIDKLQTFTHNRSMDASELSNIWRLPSPALTELCNKFLLLDGHDDSAFAQFINAIVTDAGVSLGNQCIILRHISSSKWFTNGEAIPAVINSQITSLLDTHSEAIVAGLLLPLLENPERLLQPSASMIAKLIRMEMPIEAQEIISNTLAIAAESVPQMFDETAFQIMEALVTTMPTDRVSAKWSRCWVDMLHHIVPQKRESKKLSALMLQIVNKFGNHLEPDELDQIAHMATILTTSLKKAIAAAVKRKQKG
ncbi:hypothetical protein COEREDRAFT_11054 [Coemansia reversa NRRL 1564]|uniref:Uncharacterized protein n=1 Tax=Coemansia reversa (strain ATCC 12441 / NRRL 1564) TaxID=763665 RepID=A0A2G5B445_COERN|nr:hypothetical protein COEREDRAFT_11054 [Coemansia reversa NRRL 1564]|eukprot:PIA13774.1 hypothetical protein COEREDRAFT_11054 [Coemansia reversa NRRL 1564]